MINKLIDSLKQNIFLFLFPFFFVLHGYLENYPLVPFADSLELAGYYLIAIVISIFLSRLVLSSFRKACLFVFILFFIQFFFGSMYDFAKNQLGIAAFAKYSIIIPIFLLIIIAAFIFLRRTSNSFNRIARYLSLLFIILITYDIAQLWLLGGKKGIPVFPVGLQKCDTCLKPDIFLIVADEYAGKQELKEKFGFDNSGFENDLTRRGFHVIEDSRSNYNFTPFSIASLLNMSFIPLKDTTHTLQEVPMIMKMIEENDLTRFLSGIGYKTYNYSVFDLPGEPAQNYSSFLPYKTKYITAQTFTDRIMKDIGYHLITTLKIDHLVKKQTYLNLRNNNMLYKKTYDLPHLGISPKFCYTHLSMPHPPYYFNEAGTPVPYNVLLDDRSPSKYISYLKYSNKKFIKLVDQILATSATPPIIFLISDHGYRSFANLDDQKKYSFMNFAAVYDPGREYSKYYKGLSLVNIFRVALNEQFGQRMPMLKDKTYFLKD